jgi:GNAT superfamily N-acetyltransferase
MLTISPLTPPEFWVQPGLDALIDEYADECAIAGLPPPKPDRALYDRLYASGAMRVFGVFDRGEMAGFAVVLIHQNPHYGVPLAVVESLIVAKEKRKTGAGLRLLSEVEAAAKAAGAAGVLLSAPTGSVAARVMASRYRATNRVFFRALT